MKLSRLIDKLEETETYKKFKEENPSTFFSAGFFVLDLESKSEKIQLDFFLSKQDKMVSFEYPFEKPKIYEDEIKEMLPQTTKIKVDIDDLEKLSKEMIIKNYSKIVPARIIAILQKNVWNLICMDNFFGSVRIKLDAITGEQISFSQGNLIGMMQPKK